MSSLVGRYVLVRGVNSGIKFGKLEEKLGRTTILSDCRRIWSWNGAFSLNEISVYGVAKPGQCKFSCKVEYQEILDTCEILILTNKAKDNLYKVEDSEID